MAVSKGGILAQRRFQRTLLDTMEHTSFMTMDQYIQHGNTTVVQHCVAVAQCSVYLARLFHIRVHEEELIRGALLHDYFLYDWHTKGEGHSLHGFRHPYTALKNAMKVCNLTPIEQDIIKKHMFPLTPFPPRYRESLIVCIADKICSTYETLYLCSEMKAYFHGNRRMTACMRYLENKKRGASFYKTEGSPERQE